MNNFGKYAEETWLINLPRRPDRKERALAQCRTQGFEPYVFPAFDGNSLVLEYKNSTSGRFGGPNPMTSHEICCTLSHTAILRAAYARGVKSILILEDDVIFENNFAPEFKLFWDERPSDTDICWGNIETGRTQPTAVSEHVVQHHWSWLSMFGIYTERALKAMVENFPEADRFYYAWDDYVMIRAKELGLKLYGPKKRIMRPFDHHGDSDICPRR